MARKLIVEIIGDSRSLEKTFKQTDQGVTKFGRTVEGKGKSLGKAFAGALAVGLGVGTFGRLISRSITEGTEQAVAQKQLAAQFRASGQELGKYQDQIDRTINRLSILAGIEDDEVLSAFTLSFRATQNVTQGLRLTAIAADVAKARHISLAQATLALNKAYGGNVGALRRIGITIPKALDGMEALEFVAGRFRGQAAAGTTAQDRFNVALRNTEQAIGTALLPTFNKYLGKLTKWLADTDNQKKLADNTTTAVNILADAWTVAAAAIDLYNDSTDSLIKKTGPLGTFFKVLFKPGFGLSELAKLIRGDKTPAGGTPPGVQGPTGTGAAGIPPGLTGPISGKISGSLGFIARMAKLDIALAKAQLTESRKDDRAILVAQTELIKQRLRLVKTLKERRELYQALASITGQITSIDQQAASDAEAKNQKIKDARQRALDAAKDRAAKEKAANQKELAILKQRESTLKAQIAAIQGRFKDQLEIARQGIGELFGKPAGSAESTARRVLGLSGGGGTSIQQLIADRRGQVAQAAAFQRDINRLIKRGAPNELIRQIRAAGIGSAAQVSALAGAGGADFRAFLKAFGAGEKLALNTTNTIMKAQLVTLTADKIKLENLKTEVVVHNNVHLDGQKLSANTTKHQVRAQRRTAAQRTGRIAGLGPVVG